MRSLLLLPLLLSFACTEDNQLLAPDLLEDPADRILYYPGRGQVWETRTAREAGFDSALLQEAVEYALANEADIPLDLKEYLQSRIDLSDEHQRIIGPMRKRGTMNGLILHKGYIVAEWGDTERVDMTFSVTKSFLATVIGLALDRDKIGNARERVGKLVTDGGYDSEQNRPITWQMSLRQTSEWEGELWGKPDTADRREGFDRVLQGPGTFWEYNDVRVNRTALSALRVWDEALPEVLDREIMTPIGAGRSWRWHGYRNSSVEIDGEEVQSVSGGGHWGGGMWINSRDMARFGYLYLRRGKWRNKQLLSEQWIKEATTPSELNPTYGYMWWLNTDGGLWPSVSHYSYAARGGGDNLIWIDPVHELVVVVRWIERGTQDGLLQRVVAALDPDADPKAPPKLPKVDGEAEDERD